MELKGETWASKTAAQSVQPCDLLLEWVEDSGCLQVTTVHVVKEEWDSPTPYKDVYSKDQRHQEQ